MTKDQVKVQHTPPGGRGTSCTGECSRQKLTVINKLSTFSLVLVSLVLPRPPSSCPALLLSKELLLVKYVGLLCGRVQGGHHHVGWEPRGVAGGGLHLLVGPEDGLVGRGQGRGLSHLH